MFQIYDLFKHVLPSKAYFGQKDFQQLFIIKYMTNAYNFDVEIISCKTIRSPEGLALSSRNKLLKSHQKKEALILYSVLSEMKKNKTFFSPEHSLENAKKHFTSSSFDLEYVHLVNAETLQKINSSWAEKSICCLAGHCGEVRLIDCMEI